MDKNLPVKCFKSHVISDVPDEEKILRSLYLLTAFPQDPRRAPLKQYALCISHSLNLMIPFNILGRTSHQFQTIYLKIKAHIADLLNICTFSLPGQSLQKCLFLLTATFGKAFGINMHLKPSRERIML